jgi:hypothetical protein
MAPACFYNYEMAASTIRRACFILVLASIALSCSSNDDGRSNPPNPPSDRAVANIDSPNSGPKDNPEELALIIKMPVESEDAIWLETPAGPGDAESGQRKLTAVLLLTSANAEKVVSDSLKYGPPEDVVIEIAEWFPVELISQSELSGGTGLAGTSYRADIFFQEPYVTGRLIRITGTDRFVLELASR